MTTFSLRNLIYAEFGRIHRKTAVPEPLFNKNLQPATLFKKDSDAGAFLENFERFLGTLFL